MLPKQAYRQIIPSPYLQALRQHQSRQTPMPTASPTSVGETSTPTLPPYPRFQFDPTDTEPLIMKAKRFDTLSKRDVTEAQRLQALPYIRRHLQSNHNQTF